MCLYQFPSFRKYWNWQHCKVKLSHSLILWNIWDFSSPLFPVRLPGSSRRPQTPKPYSLLCTSLFSYLHYRSEPSSCVTQVQLSLNYCSKMASSEQTTIYSATVSKLDHWPRTTSQDGAARNSVRNRKYHGTGSCPRTKQQREGNVILIPTVSLTYSGLLGCDIMSLGQCFRGQAVTSSPRVK